VPAHIVIDHAVGNPHEWLERAFGPSSSDVLAATVIGRPVQQNPSYKGWSWPGYTVIAYSPTVATLNVSIEPTGTVNLRRASETAWHALAVTAGRRVRLSSATLDDGTSGHELASATTGVLAHMQLWESLATLLTATITVIWLLIALTVLSASSEAVLGAIPALVAGFVVATRATVYGRERKLVWR
jgi:hypothetical protein